MSRQRRRTADDFVRDLKAKQQHSAPDIERKTSEGQTAKQAAWATHKKNLSNRLSRRELDG